MAHARARSYRQKDCPRTGRANRFAHATVNLPARTYIPMSRRNELHDPSISLDLNVLLLLMAGQAAASPPLARLRKHQAWRHSAAELCEGDWDRSGNMFKRNSESPKGGEL